MYVNTYEIYLCYYIYIFDSLPKFLSDVYRERDKRNSV